MNNNQQTVSIFASFSFEYNFVNIIKKILVSLVVESQIIFYNETKYW